MILENKQSYYNFLTLNNNKNKNENVWSSFFVSSFVSKQQQQQKWNEALEVFYLNANIKIVKRLFLWMSVKKWRHTLRGKDERFCHNKTGLSKRVKGSARVVQTN